MSTSTSIALLPQEARSLLSCWYCCGWRPLAVALQNLVQAVPCTWTSPLLVPLVTHCPDLHVANAPISKKVHLLFNIQHKTVILRSLQFYHLLLCPLYDIPYCMCQNLLTCALVSLAYEVESLTRLYLFLFIFSQLAQNLLILN